MKKTMKAMDESVLLRELEKNRLDREEATQELEDMKALTVQQITNELGVRDITSVVSPVKHKIPFKIRWKKRLSNFFDKIQKTVD